jgi:hypothetical protein
MNWQRLALAVVGFVALSAAAVCACTEGEQSPSSEASEDGETGDGSSGSGHGGHKSGPGGWRTVQDGDAPTAESLDRFSTDAEFDQYLSELRQAVEETQASSGGSDAGYSEGGEGEGYEGEAAEGEASEGSESAPEDDPSVTNNQEAGVDE